MFNIALALAAGITAIIGSVAIIVAGGKSQLISAVSGIRIIPSVDKILDEMDRTREARYANDRSRLIRQLNGYRSEWNSYANEWSDNFGNDMSYSCVY